MSCDTMLISKEKGTIETRETLALDIQVLNIGIDWCIRELF